MVLRQLFLTYLDHCHQTILGKNQMVTTVCLKVQSSTLNFTNLLIYLGLIGAVQVFKKCYCVDRVVCQ